MQIDIALTDEQLAAGLEEAGHDDLAKALADKVAAGGGQADGGPAPKATTISEQIRQAAGRAA